MSFQQPTGISSLVLNESCVSEGSDTRSFNCQYQFKGTENEAFKPQLTYFNNLLIKYFHQYQSNNGNGDQDQNYFDPVYKSLLSIVILITDMLYDTEIKIAHELFMKIESELEKKSSKLIGFQAFQIYVRASVINCMNYMNSKAIKWLQRSYETYVNFSSLLEGYQPSPLLEGCLPISEAIRMYNIFGDIYSREGLLDEAEKFLNKAWELIKKYDPENTRDKSWNRTNMGHVYLQKGKRLKAQGFDLKAEELYMESEEFYLEALDYRKKMKNDNFEAMSHDNLANFYLHCQNWKKALTHANDAICLVGNNQSFYLIGKTKCTLAQIYYYKEKNETKARSTFNEGIQIVKDRLPEGNDLSTYLDQVYQSMFGEHQD